MRRGFAVALAALAVLVPASAAPAQAPPVGSGEGALRLAQVGTFTSPVDVTGAPGFPRLLFVVEQPGTVRVLRRGTLLPRPFLDIRGLTICGADPGGCGEQGLLSIAFPPDYRKTRRFYVYYTDKEGDNRVAEFRRHRRHPARAAHGTLRQVLRLPHPFFENHNGGGLEFHGNRELLISTGDGGLGGDPSNNAQNPDSLLGKILRIDPVRARRGGPYRVPRSNPFVGRAGRDEVFSLGLRNPFRFSLQRRRGADRILIADVGQRRYEEINYVSLPLALGGNFGWDAYEGAAPYDEACGAEDCPLAGTPPPPSPIPPIFTYGHGRFAAADGPDGCSVTGGLIVRDPKLPSLYGRYLFADFCEGLIRSLIPGLRGARDEGPTGLEVASVSGFGRTRDGRVFVASLEGGVFRIAPG